MAAEADLALVKPVQPARPEPSLITANDFIESVGQSGDPIIPGVAQPGSGLMIYARQGLGKTRLTVQLVSALIRGEPFLELPVKKSGPVVFLQLDMPPSEWASLLRDAEEVGMAVGDDLYTLPEDYTYFNIQEDEQRDWLKKACTELQPIAVVIDSAVDAYAGERGHGDINKQILDVLHVLRDCSPRSILVYVLHTRKKSANLSQEVTDNDADAFAGPGAWERFCSTSIRLVDGKKQDEVSLKFKKTRLGGPGFTEIKMKRGELGFFEPAEPDHKRMLVSWPDCLPSGERDSIVSAIRTQQDVVRDIAQRTGAKEDTVRKHITRHHQRGFKYSWESLLQTEASG